jgi:two-component system sensor histidine kinase KdpD
MQLPASVLASARALFDAAGHGKQLPDVSSGADACLVPLRFGSEVRGVLVLLPGRQSGADPAPPAFLGAWAALICLALDRIRYAGLAQEAATAAEGERLRNAILAAVSHDLRTPIAGLTGLAGALQNQPGVDPVTASLCRAIEDEALRMEDMAGNLLQLARLSSGAPLDAQLQMLEEALGPALAHMERPLSQHKLELQIEEGLPLLRFDAVLIERVLCNLLSNAARQAPTGSRILLCARERGGGVQVSVQDQGPGMKDAALLRLQRDDDAPTGSGLGLWICQRILRAHGARLDAEPVAEGGMRFSFSLPAQGKPPGTPV